MRRLMWTMAFGRKVVLILKRTFETEALRADAVLPRSRAPRPVCSHSSCERVTQECSLVRRLRRHYESASAVFRRPDQAARRPKRSAPIGPSLIGCRPRMKTSIQRLSSPSHRTTHTMTALLQRIGAPSRASSTFKSLARCVTNSASKEILGPAGSPKPSQAIPYQEADESTPKELRQAPNHPGTWSRGQNPRPHAMSGPRFEQRDLRFQAAPFAAIDAVAQDPIRLVDGRRATCDGGA